MHTSKKKKIGGASQDRRGTHNRDRKNFPYRKRSDPHSVQCLRQFAKYNLKVFPASRTRSKSIANLRSWQTKSENAKIVGQIENFQHFLRLNVNDKSDPPSPFGNLRFFGWHTFSY